MEPTDGDRPDAVRGGPVVGPGLRAFDPDASPSTEPDLDVEPAGYLVAMDDAVRIHFLDWGEPELPRDEIRRFSWRDPGGQRRSSRSC